MRYCVYACSGAIAVIACGSPAATEDPAEAEVIRLRVPDNTAPDWFGYSVDISGDTLVVGRPGEREGGAAHVFRRRGGGWREEAVLTPSPREGFEHRFRGYAVAVSEDLLAIAVTGDGSAATGIDGDEDNNDAPASGAAYVYRNTSSGWTRDAYIKASNTGAGDRFGTSLALAGDTLVVGARFEDSAARGVNGDGSDNDAPGSGAAYVYRRTDSGWAQQAYLKASNANAGDFFGSAVALEGDLLAVGAPRESSSATGVDGDGFVDDEAQSLGAVYLFRRSDGEWSQEAYLKTDRIERRGGFGSSVAVRGNVVVVGATGAGIPQDESTGLIGPGAAYVFRHTGEAWIQEARLTASNPNDGDRFGSSVALWGDALIVGARSEDSAIGGVGAGEENDDAYHSGAAYLFRRDASGWTETAYMKAPEPKVYEAFGASAAVYEDIIVIGAPVIDDISGPEFPGSVYINQ